MHVVGGLTHSSAVLRAARDAGARAVCVGICAALTARARRVGGSGPECRCQVEGEVRVGLSAAKGGAPDS